MTIEFHKVLFAPKEITHETKGVKLEASLVKNSKHIIKLDGKLTGTARRVCDRCGDDMDIVFDETLKLFLHNGIYTQKNNDIDTIEVLDGKIDFDKLIEDEIITAQSDFAVCGDCLNKTKG